MEDGDSGAVSTLLPMMASPHPLNTAGKGGGGGQSDGLSSSEQIIVSVVVCSSVVIALLVVLVVVIVKLVRFVKTSQKFKNFMADAAKAEFSRDGNPLYSPNHAPIQLHIHLEGGSLDLKIPEPPVRMHSHPGVSQSSMGVSQSSTGMSQSQLSSSLPGLQMLGYNGNEKTLVINTNDGSGSRKVQRGGEDDGVKCDWSSSTGEEHSGHNRSSGAGFQDEQ